MSKDTPTPALPPPGKVGKWHGRKHPWKGDWKKVALKPRVIVPIKVRP